MDVSVETVTRTFAELMVAVPHANPETTWLTQAPGAFGMVTGVPFPTLNGVWALGATDPGTVAALLDQLPTDGLPYCLQASEASRPAMTRVAEGRGMTAGPDIPVMVLSSQPEPATIAGLHMREVTGAQRQLRNEVAAAGFEVPPEAIALATDLFGRVPGYRMYVGEVEGRPVTTAVSILANGGVGIFDVATPAEHRGHGYGAAITAYAVAEGFEAGADWAWLQSSTQGYRVYERLGFRTVATWGLWIGR